MAEDNSFLLVDLKEDKAKKLAQVISNDSCRKILEYLTGREKATETEIAKDLELPLSTVHYNLKHLHKSGLVVAEEFHYSKKGKEVNHYKLANKFIIIAPNNDPSFMDKLKNILPLGVFAIAAAGALQLWQYMKSSGSVMANKAILDMVAQESTPMAMKAMADNSTLAGEMVVEEASPILAHSPVLQAAASEPNTALWFLAGSVFIIIVVLIMNLVKRK